MNIHGKSNVTIIYMLEKMLKLIYITFHLKSSDFTKLFYIWELCYAY